MADFRYCVSPDIFTRYPGYIRGVVVAHGVTNGASSPELVQMLREAEESVRGRLNLEGLADEPRIKAWRDAYRLFGAKPAEFRSSVEAMARRVLRGDELPTISTLVDLGNVISLRYLVPAGGHAIDVLKGDIELRFATGREEFVPFGSENIEHPVAGEVVFVEGDTVLTRRWTWRQANHTLLIPSTRAVEVNVDGLVPVTQTEVETACRDVAKLIVRFCGGQTRVGLLSAATPCLSLAE